MGKVTGGRVRWVRRPPGRDWLGAGGTMRAWRPDVGPRFPDRAGPTVSGGPCQSLGQAHGDWYLRGRSGVTLVCVGYCHCEVCHCEISVTASTPANRHTPPSPIAAVAVSHSPALNRTTHWIASSYAAQPSRGPRIARRSTLLSAPSRAYSWPALPPK